MIKAIDSNKRIILYFFVGGTAALVEWSTFFVMANVCQVQYLLAAAAAFVIATSTNWVLGRRWAFKDGLSGKKKSKECLQVFFVSGIGLCFDLLLMYLFVSLLGMESSAQKMIAKIMATGIVFFWNYFGRKIWIYHV